MKRREFLTKSISIAALSPLVASSAHVTTTSPLPVYKPENLRKCGDVRDQDDVREVLAAIAPFCSDYGYSGQSALAAMLGKKVGYYELYATASGFFQLRQAIAQLPIDYIPTLGLTDAVIQFGFGKSRFCLENTKPELLAQRLSLDMNNANRSFAHDPMVLSCAKNTVYDPYSIVDAPQVMLVKPAKVLGDRVVNIMRALSTSAALGIAIEPGTQKQIDQILDHRVTSKEEAKLVAGIFINSLSELALYYDLERFTNLCERPLIANSFALVNPITKDLRGRLAVLGNKASQETPAAAITVAALLGGSILPEALTTEASNTRSAVSDLEVNFANLYTGSPNPFVCAVEGPEILSKANELLS